MQISGFFGRDGLRDALVAVLIAAIVAFPWLLVSEGGLGEPEPLLKYYGYILGYSFIILLLPPVFRGNRVTAGLSLLAGLVVAIFLTADLTTLRFFDSPFLKLYPYLPVTARNASFEALAGYAVSYVPFNVWLLAFTTVLLGLSASRFLHSRARARVTIILLMAVFFLATSLSADASDRPDARISALMEEPQEPLERLAGSDRSGNFTVAGSARAEPGTIILVIMESTGAGTPSSSGRGLLSRDIIEESRSGRWVTFQNAVTNSNATDISVPSLLTGSGAHEPVEKVHALPFVSQYAASRGYRTAFITSSTMRWAGFDSFFADARLDEVRTAENSGLPFINDLAVDDHFVYQSAAEAIGKADGKLFLTLYPQSLHLPFQTSSAFEIPAHVQNRRARATYIAEAGFRLLFDALRKADRLDDAFIVVTGDHGEFDYNATLRMSKTRLDSFEGGILSPIFLVKAPVGMSSRDFTALAANSGKLVANLDIAPTFADLLGGKLNKGLSYDGFSLFDDVTDDRVTYSTSTNQWRHWPKSVIAVSRGRERMICDKTNLCRLHTAANTQLIFKRQAKPDDQLFHLAARNPALRQALGQIYRGYYY